MPEQKKSNLFGFLPEKEWVLEMLRFYLDNDPIQPVLIYKIPTDRFKIYAIQDGSSSQYWMFENGDVKESSFSSFPPEFVQI